MNKLLKTELYDVNRLYDCYLNTKINIEEDKKSLENKIDYVNPFWQKILSKRKNFPEFNELLHFFRGNLATGIGKGKDDIKNERQLFKEMAVSALRKVPRDFIELINTSLIGLPFLFRYKSITASASFLSNLIGTFRITSYLNNLVNKKKNINILEIGAGWGGVAYQLLKSVDINNYVICDLHENLFISSFFLQANFPQKQSVFVIDNKVKLGNNSLVFCSPLKLKNIEGEYDLIINMESFQEMYVKDIQEYMRYAEQHLTNNGILYSENGIVSIYNTQGLPKKASDYGYCDKFNILSLENGKRFCPHMFNGNKHEIVLSTRKENQEKYNSLHLDALCYLIDVRLDEDIKNIRESYIEKNLSAKEIKFLELVNNFFCLENVNKKRIAGRLMYDLGYHSISSFLIGQLLIAKNHYKESLFYLSDAIDNGLSGLAKVNALLFISLIQKHEGIKIKKDEVIKEINSIAPEMREVASIILTSKYSVVKLSCQVAQQINVRKPKIFGHELYRIKEELARYISLYLLRKQKSEPPYCLT